MDPKPLRISKDGKRMMIRDPQSKGAFTWVDVPQDERVPAATPIAFPHLTTGQPQEWAPLGLSPERLIGLIVIIGALSVFIYLATR